MLVPLPMPLAHSMMILLRVSSHHAPLSELQRAVLRSFAGLLSLFHELGLRVLTG